MDPIAAAAAIPGTIPSDQKFKLGLHAMTAGMRSQPNDKINCNTSINGNISSLYACSLYSFMAYHDNADKIEEELMSMTLPLARRKVWMDSFLLHERDTAISATTLGLPEKGMNGKIPYTYKDQVYACGDAAAYVAIANIEDTPSLVIAFRGTDSFKDLRYYLNFDSHYKLFEPLLAKLDAFVSDYPEIEKIFATGHSMGGAMVERYLASHKDGPLASKIRGATFGTAGGNNDDGQEPRLVNVIHKEDIVPKLSSIRYTIHGKNIYAAKANIDGLVAHSSEEYVYTTRQALKWYSDPEARQNWDNDSLPNLGVYEKFDGSSTKVDSINNLPDHSNIGKMKSLSKFSTMIGGFFHGIMEKIAKRKMLSKLSARRVGNASDNIKPLSTTTKRSI